ncbi:MAG: L-threonylcarbamoyladenylate synthase [Planctomycetota bacterium]|nr:L-threonylcarbamoyladenylate synthase [Planctomycetota bacterium]MDA1180659.1 L-threonylcarbamoyladenylate synthase [Planctomycetota bacterium]
MKAIGNDVEFAAGLLRSGKLVAFATETVYGLGANAWNESAVARVFAVKNRPHFDPLIVHLGDTAMIPFLVQEWPELAQRLAECFWPGPLTLVVPKNPSIPDLVTAGLPTVGIRMPQHPLALAMLRLANLPIAAPSANPFGRLSPTCAEHVQESLGAQVDYVLDGGPCSVGLESTVLRIEGASVHLLRPGGISLEAIEQAIGVTIASSYETTADHEPSPAPGMMTHHYAPLTPLHVVDSVAAIAEVLSGDSHQRFGLLALTDSAHAQHFAAVEILSPGGDLTQAAANFFAALRRLDQAGLSRIYAARLPNEGLGRAMNDRLRRAAVG